MDFFDVRERSIKRGQTDIYPEFKVCRSKDLMIRGGDFHAVWDEAKGMWSTDEYDVQRLVDQELYAYAEKRRGAVEGLKVLTMQNFSTGSWRQFKNYAKLISDSNHVLDENLTFADTVVKREDYVSKRLPYVLQEGSLEGYEAIMSTLYDPGEREKLEWAIGSIVSGDSKKIQKFVVLYGEGGSGKSTVLNIIAKLFQGYITEFDAKALGSQNGNFATDVFRTNPLVGLQYDGDLSRIEDNTKINSIVAHENMVMNEKFKSSYSAKTNCFLFLGTNKPVKITDAKSGIIRRLIDVKPSGRKLPRKKYDEAMSKIDFELGAIAKHCLDEYKALGKGYYDDYKPLEMIYKTDVFFNFVESCYDEFKAEDAVSLTRAYDVYKNYCEDSLVEFKLPRYKFREELKNYFKEFRERDYVDGASVYSRYVGFRTDKFNFEEPKKPKADADIPKDPFEDLPEWLHLDSESDILDRLLADFPAQYADTVRDKPVFNWANVTTTLRDIERTREHYINLDPVYIVIDFDFKKDGVKDMMLNLLAASKWPKTYAEFSRSGGGLHLHYIYDGDPTKLSSVYDEHTEIKVYTGNQSLRRRFTKCNGVEVAHIGSGLPIKEEKMVKFEGLKSEKQLRTMLIRNMRKEYHANTKPSVDFIKQILDDAYASGLVYDVTDMKNDIIAFAMSSTNHAEECLKTVSGLNYKSKEEPVGTDVPEIDERRIVFFDVEVFPNLFLVVWKFEGEGCSCVRMINPKPTEIEELMKFRLVGFNNRDYDNHILYARYLGYSELQLYELSQRIIGGDRNAKFGEAYNISYTDIYDFSSKKQSLKKFEIELGIRHLELGLPWDKPVDPALWDKVAEYCCNDVISTEAVFNNRKGDWTARQILAALSGLTVNDKTNSHTARIIFGKDKHPGLIYTDFATGMQYDSANNPIGVSEWNRFEGYEFIYDDAEKCNKNMYRGEDVGFGGLVRAKPGMYIGEMVTFDVASMHPHSVLALNAFGEHTGSFADILNARILIKHKDFEKAKRLMGGKLAPYLDNPDQAKALAQALKIAINSVYGLTSAKFDNPFRDLRNKNNIVALRGALFMKTLMDEVEARGGTVVHIKTDSIKVFNPTEELKAFICDFGEKYGYTFEIEHIFDRFCLVNDAVYIGHLAVNDPDDPGKWEATGTQFAVPYVFKQLFSHEELTFDDFCETKSVKSAIYLDFDEKLENVLIPEHVKELRRKEPEKRTKSENLTLTEWESVSDGELDEIISRGHNYRFVGKVGQFTPMLPGAGGARLLRQQEDKYYSVTGANGYRWMESEEVRLMGLEDRIDKSYYRKLADDARDTISAYGDFEQFTDVETYGTEG